MAITRIALLLLVSLTIVPTAGPLGVPDSVPDSLHALPPPTAAPVSMWATLSSDGIASVRDAGAILTSPLHARAGAWVLVGSGIAAAGVCALVDDDVREIAQRHQSSTGDIVTFTGDLYGRTSTVAVIGGTLYGTGLLFGNSWLHDTGRRALVALILAGATSTGLKMIVGRARPYVNRGAAAFDYFTTDNDYNSFPSGHATAAFTISSVLAVCIDNPWATTALYALACLTAAQRVYADDHWLSDVATGALIGIAYGQIAARVGRDANDKRAWRLVPTVSRGGYGLALNWGM